MLFNSYVFILVFLPIALAGFYLLARFATHRIALSWLVGASLFFYGWWNPAYLALITGSILFNYSIGLGLDVRRNARSRRPLFILGVSGNLGLLGYFKYANFFVNELNGFVGSSFHLETIILPLAISFFTFQQIAYLADAYKGTTQEHSFLHYCLFVTFFPQLIAGPIVHHKEMLPQFSRSQNYRIDSNRVAVGVTIFAIGLIKKVVIADGMSLYANPIFDAAGVDLHPTLVEAWAGSLAYSFQLYFDFSGYSDMAIGLARLFGIVLPMNFDSPYKSLNIREFWRRWHITLSRFLRDYLYIPLGGNRKGQSRRYANLMATMLLGGLWHGAGWNFLLWGGLHGLFLVIADAWHSIKPTPERPSKWRAAIAWGVTYAAIVFAWVPFRATSSDATFSIWKGMLGLNGVSLPRSMQSTLGFPAQSDLSFVVPLKFEGVFSQVNLDPDVIWWMLTLLLLVLLMPNTQQFMRRFEPVLDLRRVSPDTGWHDRITWRPTFVYAAAIALCFLYALSKMSEVNEFLYFNF